MKVRRGRPLGDFSSAVLHELSQGPATIREIALRHQLAIGPARDVADRMRQAGRIVVVDRVRPPVGRPESVLGLAVQMDGNSALQALHRAITGRP